jgi:hypothetical protein
LRHRFGVVVIVCIFLFQASLSSLAQSPTATVNGRVRDTTGAAVRDADVQLINDRTNIKYPTRTNSEGIYSIVGVAPGIYRIQVAKAGFKTIIQSDVTLNVLDARAINFELPVGAVSEVVTVEGGAPTVNTESASVSTVVDRQFAENLPMNGRSFQTLIELTPGVVSTPSNSSDGGQFSINGQRAASNYWMVDGVSANVGAAPGLSPGNGAGGTLGSFSVLGGTNSLVSVDAMQEFRIQTSTFAPEFGRTPGGQISIVTRSGTNQFHGTAFDYLRNDVLDANNWFNGYTNSPPLPKAKERQNDFGGTLSAPIFKDKTFFFFSYEGLRLRLPQTALTTVPCDSTCTVFGDIRTTATPGMQPFLNAYPLPNGPEVFTPCTPNLDGCPPSGEQPIGAAQFNASYSNPATLDAYSIRIDHKLSDKLSLFGRYNYSPSQLVASGADALSVLSTSRIAIQTATVGATWAMSPATANDLRFNYSRTDPTTHLSLDNFGGAVPLASLPFPSGDSSQNAVFTLSIGSLKNGSLPVGQGGQNALSQINIVDSLSMQKGSHTLKFGVDFRRLASSLTPPAYGQSIDFSDVPSTQSGDLAYGVIGSVANVTVLFHNLGAFAQDTWHIAPRLSLTYGLRWDVDFAPSLLNHLSIPAVTGYNLNDFSQLAIAPTGTPPFKTTYGNVAPRIGLAYQLTQSQEWSTVLRGGFGVFYDLVSSETGSLVSSVAAAPPLGAEKFVLGSIFGGTSTFPLTPPDMAPPTVPPSASISQQLYAFNPNLRLPYTLEWNLAFEQALGKQQTITTSYVGAAGRRLLQTSSVTAPSTNPNVSAEFVDNTAVSGYNALQIEFQRRLSHGLQALASYTWSHSIDDGSAGSTSVVSNVGAAGSNGNANRGPSDFDTRNTFVAGVTYDLPAPSVKALVSTILNGWSTENFILAHSATPVDISDVSFTSGLNGINVEIRPDLVPGQPLYLFGAQCAAIFQVPKCPGGKGFNLAAFTDPPFDPNTGAVLRQGNVPRNFLRGFGAAQWDFAVHRDFPIRESLKLQFRAELFNVLNHPNFGPPSGSFVSPAFGGPTAFGLSTEMLGQSLNSANLGGGALSPLYQIGGPRSIQFALKLSF